MPCPIAAVTQIGNAVAPPMAAALGRCLLLAAAKKAPVAEPVIPVSEACTAYPAFLFSVQSPLRPYPDGGWPCQSADTTDVSTYA